MVLCVVVEVVIVPGQPTSPPKNNFGRGRHDVVFSLSWYQRTASPIASLFSRCYSDSATGDSSFGVCDGDGKGGMSPSTTHLSSERDSFFDVLEHHIMNIYSKGNSYFQCLNKLRINNR